MDDVDYLVEDKAMDDFFLSPEMDGTHEKSTFEDDIGQQLPRKAAYGELAQWRCKLGTKSSCWECSNHHICLRFRSDW